MNKARHCSWNFLMHWGKGCVDKRQSLTEGGVKGELLGRHAEGLWLILTRTAQGLLAEAVCLSVVHTFILLQQGIEDSEKTKRWTLETPSRKKTYEGKV